MPRGRYPFKPGLRTVNHCFGGQFTTTGGTTTQRVPFTTVESPTDRDGQLPVGAVLTQVWVRYFNLDGIPPNGQHLCLMTFQPGGTTYSDPIAAWTSTTNPLTEENIQVRQNKMGELGLQYIQTNVTPLKWSCLWRGKKLLRQGDDVVVSLRDALTTNWEEFCIARYIY